MKKTMTAALVIAAMSAAVRSQDDPGAKVLDRITDASPPPQSISVVGGTDAFYDPTTWPVFGASRSNNEGCASGLRANLSGRYKSDTHPNAYPKALPQTIISRKIGLGAMGLGGYRRTAKLLVAWTVRVEAYQALVNPATNNPQLCSPWRGSIEENFTGGEVDTMLFVDGRQVGNTASMTFPPLGSGVNNFNPSDPTITNSVTLTADTFAAGEIPEAFTLDIRWVNRTIGSSIKAPAYMRNMTVFVLPVGK